MMLKRYETIGYGLAFVALFGFLLGWKIFVAAEQPEEVAELRKRLNVTAENISSSRSLGKLRRFSEALCRQCRPHASVQKPLYRVRNLPWSGHRTLGRPCCWALVGIYSSPCADCGTRSSSNGAQTGLTGAHGLSTPFSRPGAAADQSAIATKSTVQRSFAGWYQSHRCKYGANGPIPDNFPAANPTTISIEVPYPHR